MKLLRLAVAPIKRSKSRPASAPLEFPPGPAPLARGHPASPPPLPSLHVITYPTTPGSAAPPPRHVGWCVGTLADGWAEEAPRGGGRLNPDLAGQKVQGDEGGIGQGIRAQGDAALVDGFLVAALRSPSRLRSSQARFIFLKDKWIYCSPISARTVAPILTPGGRARVARGENGARESR